MRFIARSDVTTNASGEKTPQAGGFTAFATEVAQRISPTLKELEPLSAADAAQWVEYWSAVGMFE